MNWERVRILLVSFGCFSVVSCSSVEYVTSREVPYVKASGFSEDHLDSKKKQFGALLFKAKKKSDTPDDTRAFLIRKDSSSYVAETLLYDNSFDDKATFEKTYFSFGADKKNKRIGLKLRFVY